jgi:hypothetical protein
LLPHSFQFIIHLSIHSVTRSLIPEGVGKQRTRREDVLGSGGIAPHVRDQLHSQLPPPPPPLLSWPQSQSLRHREDKSVYNDEKMFKKFSPKLSYYCIRILTISIIGICIGIVQ